MLFRTSNEVMVRNLPSGLSYSVNNRFDIYSRVNNSNQQLGILIWVLIGVVSLQRLL